MAEPGQFRCQASAVRLSGCLLCRSLAAAMVTAAMDAVLDPQASWWGAVWSLPWWVACGAALAWAVLRVREKAARRPPYGGAQSDWAQAA